MVTRGEAGRYVVFGCIYFQSYFISDNCGRTTATKNSNKFTIGAKALVTTMTWIERKRACFALANFEDGGKVCIVQP